MTVPDVMALLGCQRSKVYEMFHAGDLAGFRVGRSVKVFRGSVDDYRNRMANSRPAPQPTPRASPANRRKKALPLLPLPRVGGYGHGL